jgi:uncharacterized spore protein YtfJ
MDVQETIAKARDAITVKRVYGAPYERDGTTVIPAAAVGGGGGGGSGEDPKGQTGGGSGFGISARPVGAYVLSEGNVRWEPAVDVNRIATQAIAAAAVVALALAWLRRD